MREKMLILGVICLLFLSSCKKGVENPHSNDLSELVGLPIIHYFTATPEQILWGESFTLTWHVTNGTYWIITDHKGVAWFDSGHIDNPWEEGTSTLRPDYLGEWSGDEITTFTLTARNGNGHVRATCTIEVTPGFAEVVMQGEPTGQSYSNFYDVLGGVKNIGSISALNTKVSVELWGCYGNLLASGECIVGGDGFVLQPQQSAGWGIKFDDASGVLYRQMNQESEIRCEVTWDEGT